MGAMDPEKRDENGRNPVNGQFAPGNGGGGRKRMDPEVRSMLEARTKDAVDKLIQCLEAERVIVVGFGEAAHTEMVPDYDLQLKAANAILDRAYGKPAQAVTGDDGGPIQIHAVNLLDVLKSLAK